MCDSLKNIPNEELYFIDKTPYPQCVICMELIKEKNKSILSCGHEYHSSCLMENVLKSNNSCPLCRDVVCEKAIQLPKLSEPIIHSFLESSFSNYQNEKIKSYLQKILLHHNVDWNASSLENKKKDIDLILKLLLGFGYQLGETISNWISDESRLQDDHVIDNQSLIEVHNGVLDSILTTLSNNEELEPLSLSTLFDEETEDTQDNSDEDTNDVMEDDEFLTHPQSDVEEFISEYNLFSYKNRILSNDYLNDIDNLLSSDIETLMWPLGTNNLNPLFTRQEAEHIMNAIIQYFAIFLEE